MNAYRISWTNPLSLSLSHLSPPRPLSLPFSRLSPLLSLTTGAETEVSEQEGPAAAQLRPEAARLGGAGKSLGGHVPQREVWRAARLG